MKKYNISIYTSGGFPFGAAAESFVRNMAEGLEQNGNKISIFTIHGNYLENGLLGNYENIYFSNVCFNYKKKNEWHKILEFISLIVFLPFHLIWQKYKFNTNVVLLYCIEYPYYTIPIHIVSRLFGIKIFRIVTDRYSKKIGVPHG